MENGMQMTLEECMPETFQKQTAGASDSLASFEELIFLQKKDIYQLKTYLSGIECLLTREDGKQLPQLQRKNLECQRIWHLANWHNSRTPVLCHSRIRTN